MNSPITQECRELATDIINTIKPELNLLANAFAEITEEYETRHAAVMLHTQGVVDENTQLRKRLEEATELLDIAAKRFDGVYVDPTLRQRIDALLNAEKNFGESQSNSSTEGRAAESERKGQCTDLSELVNAERIIAPDAPMSSNSKLL